MTTSVVVDVEGLTVTHGDVTAVRDLSFQVRQGEVYALLGDNGAGKTSTLEVVQGRRPATSGTVRVLGRSPLDRPAVLLRTGTVPELASSPDLTVRESVGLVGSSSGRPDDVDRVLDVVGLARKAGALVSQLSGGEQRRLDVATAVHGGPELVVLDDPTSGLDRRSGDALWDALHRLRDDGSTVLLTSHRPDEVQQRADRIGLLHEGTLRREGTVAELMESLPSVISFALPPGAPEPPIVGSLNGAFRIRTFNLQLDLHRLMVWAHDNGVQLPRLRVEQPRLDDAVRGSDAT